MIFSDSFDDRPIASIGDRYSAHQYNVSAGSAIAAGRTGNGLVLSTGILDVFDHITFDFSSRQSVYVGVARRDPGESTALCSIRLNGIPHIFAQLNDNSTVSVINYDGGLNTILATSSQTVPQGEFFYVELYGKIDPIVGAYELRIDGTRWLSASGVDTSSDGSSLANQVRLIYNHSSVDGHLTTVDDFYIADDDADGGDALIVGFAGPVKIACLEETGAGASTEWTPLSGTNVSNLDDGAATGKDDDTTYNATLTEGAADLFAIDPFSVVGATVKAVAVHQWCKKMDATSRSVKPLAYVSPTEYSGDETALGTTYARVFHAFERNPATGAAWTRAEVAAAQFGIALAEA